MCLSNFKNISFFLYILGEKLTMKHLDHVHLDVDMDHVLTKVGVFGRWQQRTVFLLMIASFIGGKTKNCKANHF